VSWKRHRSKCLFTRKWWNRCYHYVIKILNVCLCVMKVGSSGGGPIHSTAVVIPTYYTLYCVCVITSRHTRHNRGASWSRHNREQWQKWMQLGSSSWSGCNRDTVGSEYARLVLARDTTAQGCWCVRVGGYARLRCGHRSITKREMSCATLCYWTWTEVRAPPTSAPWRGAGLLI